MAVQNPYLQQLRYKLQKRVRRLNGADHNTFMVRVLEFFSFFDSQPILKALAEEITAKCPDYAKWVEAGMIGDKELENAAIGYGVLRSFIEGKNPHGYMHFLLMHHAPPKGRELDLFKTLYVEPLYEYLDERIDDQSFVLAALVRYKHLCEWFRRKRLFDGWEEDTARGEHLLAMDLYEYLFEHGIDVDIEPSSASGEVDMISLQRAEDPLLADAKIFNPEKSKSKSYLIKGFHQIYQYACDYNQAVGYLVIFNTSDFILRFALGSEAEPLPRVRFNHKTIFFIVIDIYPHEKSASKKPVPQVVELSEEEIVSGNKVQG